MRGVHIYVHVPFCVDPCGYCDFYRGPYRAGRERVYLEALLHEMDLRLPESAPVDSLYFGGGTPSLLSNAAWETIFSRMDSSRRRGAEISLEANPASITLERARFWKDLGFTRVSVGVQSLNDDILRFLNRLHTADMARTALDILATVGFQSISADLIYGIPDQTIRDVRASVAGVSRFVQHLSAYALTIEPGTPFGRRGVRNLDADDAARQYETIVDLSARAGFRRYEISNFARPGHECAHNQNTWRYGRYIGLGPSAVGFDGEHRYRNVADLGRYAAAIRSGTLPEEYREAVNGRRFQERLLLGLRTREGARLSARDRIALRSAAGAARLSGFFRWTPSGARLRPDAMLILDEILARLPAGSPS